MINRDQIVHRTVYSYSGCVPLGSHELRLRPREGHKLRIEFTLITIQPEASLHWHRDVEDNSFVMARFTAPADRLLIENSLIIQQYDQEPLDYLVENYAVSSLFAYAPEDCFVHVASLLAGPGSHAGTFAPWKSTIWHPGEAVESYALLQRLSLAIH
ncbi:MAG: transglutaminase N-terminal domain-containing protein, partial [Prochlorococcaceae cyanobacterium]